MCCCIHALASKALNYGAKSMPLNDNIEQMSAKIFRIAFNLTQIYPRLDLKQSVIAMDFVIIGIIFLTKSASAEFGIFY